MKLAKEQKISQKKDSSDSSSIGVMIIKETFNFLNNILSIFKTPQGIMWGPMMVFMYQMAVSQAAAVPQKPGPIQTPTPDAFSHLQPGSSMIIFQASSIETKNFVYHLGEIKNGIYTGLGSSCSAIHTMNKQCTLRPENCQAAKLSLINLESAMVKDLQTHYSLQRICEADEVPSSKEAIQRCHAGISWAPGRYATEDYTINKTHSDIMNITAPTGEEKGTTEDPRQLPPMINLFNNLVSFIRNFIFSSSKPWFFQGTVGIKQDTVQNSTVTQEEDFTPTAAMLEQDTFLDRVRRFVVSRSVLIATAFGVAGLATAAGTAHAIASNQAHKVLKEEQAHRVEYIKNSITNDKFNLRLIKGVGSDIDGVRQATTLATHAQTNLNQAISLNNEFSHLVSRSGTLKFSEPSQEVYLNAIGCKKGLSLFH